MHSPNQCKQHKLISFMSLTISFEDIHLKNYNRIKQILLQFGEISKMPHMSTNVLSKCR